MMTKSDAINKLIESGYTVKRCIYETDGSFFFECDYHGTACKAHVSDAQGIIIAPT